MPLRLQTLAQGKKKEKKKITAGTRGKLLGSVDMNLQVNMNFKENFNSERKKGEKEELVATVVQGGGGKLSLQFLAFSLVLSRG